MADLNTVLHDLRAQCEPGCERAHPCLCCRAAEVLERAERERDEARRLLGECYLASGADPDGNAADSPHLWPYALAEVQRLRAEAEDDAAAAEMAEARALIRSLLGTFTEAGHLPERCYRSTWFRADAVDAWRARWGTP